MEQVLEPPRTQVLGVDYADSLLRHACYCSEFVTAALAAEPALAERLLRDGALEQPFDAER